MSLEITGTFDFAKEVAARKQVGPIVVARSDWHILANQLVGDETNRWSEIANEFVGQEKNPASRLANQRVGQEYPES